MKIPECRNPRTFFVTTTSAHWPDIAGLFSEYVWPSASETLECIAFNQPTSTCSLLSPFSFSLSPFLSLSFARAVVQGRYPLHRALVRPRQLRRARGIMHPAAFRALNQKKVASLGDCTQQLGGGTE